MIRSVCECVIVRMVSERERQARPRGMQPLQQCVQPPKLLWPCLCDHNNPSTVSHAVLVPAERTKSTEMQEIQTKRTFAKNGRSLPISELMPEQCVGCEDLAVVVWKVELIAASASVRMKLRLCILPHRCVVLDNYCCCSSTV